MCHWRRRLGSIPCRRISNFISYSHLYWSYNRWGNNREWNRPNLLTNAFHPSSLFRPETIGGCHHPDSMGAHVYAPLDASAPDDSATDRGTGSPKRSNASSTKNEELGSTAPFKAFGRSGEHVAGDAKRRPVKLASSSLRSAHASANG